MLQPRELNERFRVYERRARRIRSVRTGMLVVCCIVGAGAVLPKAPSFEGVVRKSLTQALAALSAPFEHFGSKELQVAAAGSGSAGEERPPEPLSAQPAPDSEPVPAAPAPQAMYQTIEQRPVIERVIERVVQGSPVSLAGYVTQADLAQQIAAVRQGFGTQLYGDWYQHPGSAPSNGGILGAIGMMGRIDTLSGTHLSGVTLDRVQGLTDADIPDGITASNYLALTGGAIAGDLSLSGTLSAGALTVAAVSSGGAVEAPYFTATSSSAPSVFPNLSATNATTTHATSTTLFSVLGRFTDAIVETLSAVTATITDLTATTLVATNVTTEQLNALDAVAVGRTATTTIRGDGAASTLPYASTTAITANTVYLASIASGLLSTNAAGQILATSSIGTNLLTGIIATINGTSIDAGESVTLTTASSTLHTDNNTFSGAAIFSQPLSLTSTSGTTTIASGQGFTVGGSQFIVQQGSGFVGIGTTTPVGALSVVNGADNQFNLANSFGKQWTQGVRQATGDFFLAENGVSEWLRIQKATGNVGIGTTTPAAQLTVTGGSATYAGKANVTAIIGLGSTYNNLLLGSTNGNSPFLASEGASPLSLWTNATERLSITSGGNVGIGTTNPSAKLTLSNNVATDFLDNFGEYQLLMYDSGVAASSYGLGIKGNTMVFNSGSGAYSFDAAGGSTSLSIQTNGTVGIGTTTPAAMLEISALTGDESGIHLGRTGWASKLRIGSVGSSGDDFWLTNNYNVAAGTVDSAANGLGSFARMGPGVVTFGTTDTASVIPTERVRITSTGLVGIGTTNPQKPLEIQGLAGSGLRVGDGVGNSAWTYDMSRDNATGYLNFYGNQSGANGYIFGGADGERMRIATNGAVGIGTTNIVGALTVANGTDHTLNVRGDPASFGLPSGLLGPILQGVNSAQDLTTPITLFATSINLMSGYVGIGTTNPGVKLDVSGVIQGSGDVISNVTGGSYLKSMGTTQSTLHLNLSTNAADQRGVEWIQSDATFRGRFVNDAYNAEQDFMKVERNAGTYTVKNVLFPNGNVGIGTASPQKNLHISGSTDSIGGRIEYTGSTQYAGAGIELKNNVSSTTQQIVRLGNHVLDGSNAQSFFTIDQYDGAGSWVRGLASMDIHSQQWDFNTSGTPRLTIDSAGRVGIGTQSPSATLSVPTGLVQFPGAGGDYTWFNFNNSTNYIRGTTYFGGDTGVWTADGNVGIGKTSPAAKLDVGGTIAINRNALYLAAHGDGNHAISNGFETINGSSDGETFVGHDFINLKSNAYGGSLLFMSGITGNVGIGTTTPDAKLAVAGDISLRNTTSSGVSPSLYFHDRNSIPDEDGADMSFLSDSLYIQNRESGSIFLLTGGSITLAAAGTGNVGIGTASPNDGKLEVKGGTVCVDTNSDNTASSCIASESDERLKTNIQAISASSSLEIISALNPVSFDWRASDPSVLAHWPSLARYAGHERSIGFIAQQVMPVLPEALALETVGDSEVQYYQLDYTKFIPHIIGALKQVWEKVQELGHAVAALLTNDTKQDAEIETLKNRMNQLESQLGAASAPTPPAPPPEPEPQPEPEAEQEPQPQPEVEPEPDPEPQPEPEPEPQQEPTPEGATP